MLKGVNNPATVALRNSRIYMKMADAHILKAKA